MARDIIFLWFCRILPFLFYKLKFRLGFATASESNPPKATLPHDIISVVLSRLRVRDLCRLRCVSKSWRALISDPAFQRNHRRIRENNPLLLVTRIDDAGSHHAKITHSIWDKESKTLDPVTHLTLEEEGIRCALPSNAITSMGLVCNYDSRNVYLCNPVTKNWIHLPGNSLPPGDMHIYTRHVALGYIASTTSYKVFRIFNMLNENYYNAEYRFEVLTLGSSRWRAVDGPPGDVLFDFHCGGKGTTIDGSFYLLWGDRRHSRNWIITVFDLNEEAWSFVPFPSDHHDDDDDDDDEDDEWGQSLMEMGGQLCFAHWCNTRVGHCIALWLLKGLHENMPTWEKECSIDIPMVAYRQPYPLAIEQVTGKILLRTMESGPPPRNCKLLCYDMKDKTMEEIYSGQSYITASFYVESFHMCHCKNEEWGLVMGKNKFDCEYTVPIDSRFGFLDEDEDVLH